MVWPVMGHFLLPPLTLHHGYGAEVAASRSDLFCLGQESGRLAVTQSKEPDGCRLTVAELRRVH